MRFDYDGTGDSPGSGDDPDRVEAWLGSVTDAIDLVAGSGWRSGRSRSSACAPGPCSLRQQPARDGRVADLVLWDPCTTGPRS